MEFINVTASNDLDMKINAILSIIVQDDGDSFAKRAEMYYQKRPELIQMLEDLHKSYRSLAEKYDQMRSEVNDDSHRSQIQGVQKFVEGNKELNGVQSNSHSKSSTAEDPDHDTEFDDDYSNGQADEFTPADSSKSSRMEPYGKNQDQQDMINGIGFRRTTSDGSQAAMLENEKLWNELRFKVSELVEDNLSHQAELIRRNDEKRETIRDLCTKLNMVTQGGENWSVKSRSSLVSHKVLKKSRSQLSRLKRLFLGRFLK
ncbi:protein NETWORKED 3A-like [Durio zibethinus]|uniref:Protein NETWORKED 3A-like n=1 Tax=Durio zibethinus TaxID=66656 RepID=A0A6P6ACK7_DURZI|nr:protein NETWORKED 3A-like [Durio zibethinus]